MKKLPTLHILNGDASLPALKAAKLPGQVLVWREILSEGPAIASLPEHTFWQKRQRYITETYGETAEAYKEKVLDELPKLNAAGTFFEVVLWFDADLMCQVNLLYLLHRIYQLQPTAVYVCTPPLHQNISLLHPEDLQQLFETRQQQTSTQLKQAHELWQLYAGPDPIKLQLYVQQPIALQHHLRQAIKLHLGRFPNCGNGLGQPETALLKLIQEGADTTPQLMQQFWQHYPGYGFGDWQIIHLLRRLQPELVHETEHLAISALGLQVLQEHAVFKLKAGWFGGFKINNAPNSLCYNPILQQLQMTSSL